MNAVMRLTRRTAALALVALAVAALAAACGGGSEAAPPAPAPSGAEAPKFEELLDIPQAGPVLGAPDASVTLVEFADLQCPFCADWAERALPTVIDEYVRTGQVQLHFNGMAFIGPDSETALRTVAAAGLQDRLWEMLELLYANQGGENEGWVTDELVRRIGAVIPDLDVEQLLEDRDSDAVTEQLEAWAATAAANGIESTPSFMAGNTGATLERVELGSLDADGITPTLDELLAG